MSFETVQAQSIDSSAIFMAQIEESLNYETGVINISDANASITIPKGFKFLDKKQANFVLSEIWGNPEDEDVLGLIVPASKGVTAHDSWVFTISYNEIGFVKDNDAKDINYETLLKEQQAETKEYNLERTKLGYPTIELVGWATKPYYDTENKVLLWAKNLKFEESESNTLNYNLRILGRKGMILLNAVANIDQLQEVEASIPQIIASTKFESGFTYNDFDSGIDQVAAYTVGGLVAGKILAKTGLWVTIAKFWKLIAAAFAGGFALLYKRFKGEKQTTQETNV